MKSTKSPINKKLLKEQSRAETTGIALSEDIGFFELRITQKIRVHGFQAQAAFFLVLLDRGHRVFPG